MSRDIVEGGTNCQVGKIHRFLTINNQLKIQITENLKCQQKPCKAVNRALYTTKFLGNQPRLPSIQQNWNLEEELLPKMGGRAGPRVSTGQDVPLSLCPGIKKNSSPGVPLSRVLDRIPRYKRTVLTLSGPGGGSC